MHSQLLEMFFIKANHDVVEVELQMLDYLPKLIRVDDMRGVTHQGLGKFW